jgi:DNA-binding GntR family transcriptional regulator
MIPRARPRRRLAAAPSPSASAPAAHEHRPSGELRDRHVGDRVQVVAGLLEQDIVLGRLQPRERLVEDDLCARFALKRHVARRVLAQLQARGLAEHTPHVGTSVKSFLPAQVAELYEIRTLLECSAAARMPLPQPTAALAPLRRLQDEHDAAVACGDLGAAFQSNLRFHEGLFALCGNAALTEAIGEYARRTHPIRSSAFAWPGYLERSRDQHHAMLDALAAGDRAQLVRLCGEHLVPSRDLYLHRPGDPEAAPA